MKKTYNVAWGPTFWECTIVIDETPEVIAMIKQLVEFWSNWKIRLKTNDGDYIKTFLQQVAQAIHVIQLENDYNVQGVIAEFEDFEGYCKMDGSMGVEITEVEDFSFDYNEYVIMGVHNG